MKEPTKPEIKEFWEGYGLHTEFDENFQRWFVGDALLVDTEFDYDRQTGTWVPSIDLKNLFKYAVPKTIKSIAKMFEESEADAYDRLFDWWAEIVAENPDKPDLALFQVLELQAKEEKSNE